MSLAQVGISLISAINEYTDINLLTNQIPNFMDIKQIIENGSIL